MSEAEDDVGPNNITVDHALDLAAQAFSSDLFTRAEEICLEILNGRPNNAAANYLIASVCLKKEDFDRAEFYFSKAIDTEPNSADAHVGLSQALQNLGRQEAAIDHSRTALEIDPKSTTAWFFLGFGLMAVRRLNEAAECFQKALNLKSEFPQAHYNLGLTHEMLGDRENAISNYKSAIDQKADYIGAKFNLHAAHYNDGELPRAIACLESAISLEPDNKKVQFFLGMLYEYTGNLEAAADLFNRLIGKKGEINLECWQYIKSIEGGIPNLFGCTSEGLRLGCDASNIEGLNLEFGVWNGVSIRQIAEYTGQTVHGFDTFQGLPENWHNLPTGEYSANWILPEVPPTVHLHAGLFEETLPAFLETENGPIRFMNIDCDLYSSTKTIFEILNERIKPGTIIVFDEYIGNPHWKDDEFRAFQEAVEDYNWRYKYLAISLYSKQAIVEMI